MKLTSTSSTSLQYTMLHSQPEKERLSLFEVGPALSTTDTFLLPVSDIQKGELVFRNCDQNSEEDNCFTTTARFSSLMEVSTNSTLLYNIIWCQLNNKSLYYFI